MRNLHNICWWLIFTIMGIMIQAVAPGIDALVVGFIILLQERDYRTMAWLLPLFILLQEGMGTQAFGAVAVWYAAVAGAHTVGCRLFNAAGFLFVFLLSGCLGAAFVGVAWLMRPLQEGPGFDLQAMLDLGMIQAIYIPAAWWIFASMRPQGQEEHAE